MRHARLARICLEDQDVVWVGVQRIGDAVGERQLILGSKSGLGLYGSHV